MEKDNVYWWCIAKGCTRTRKNDEDWVDDQEQFEKIKRLTEQGHKHTHFSPYCNVHTTMVISGEL